MATIPAGEGGPRLKERTIPRSTWSYSESFRIDSPPCEVAVGEVPRPIANRHGYVGVRSARFLRSSSSLPTRSSAGIPRATCSRTVATHFACSGSLASSVARVRSCLSMFVTFLVVMLEPRWLRCQSVATLAAKSTTSRLAFLPTADLMTRGYATSCALSPTSWASPV